MNWRSEKDKLRRLGEAGDDSNMQNDCVAPVVYGTGTVRFRPVVSVLDATALCTNAPDSLLELPACE
jgi:hypothetical protein